MVNKNQAEETVKIKSPEEFTILELQGLLWEHDQEINRLQQSKNGIMGLIQNKAQEEQRKEAEELKKKTIDQTKKSVEPKNIQAVKKPSKK